MASYTTSNIESWERFYRANFINSLTGFKSVNLIGSVNEMGQTNLSIFSSIVHIGSNPPFIPKSCLSSKFLAKQTRRASSLVVSLL